MVMGKDKRVFELLGKAVVSAGLQSPVLFDEDKDTSILKKSSCQCLTKFSGFTPVGLLLLVYVSCMSLKNVLPIKC